jgi:hypothetical protein
MKVPSTLAAIALLATAPLSRAAIVLSGNISGSTTLTITADIVFNIISSGNASFLVFDEWTTSDGTQSGSNASPEQNFAYERNGVSGTVVLGGLYDNFADSFGGFTANDGFIFFTSIAVVSGDTFRVLAGSYTFDGNSAFNPLLEGRNFTGDVFLVGSDLLRISNTVTVPEPASALLAAFALPALLRRKR